MHWRGRAGRLPEAEHGGLGTRRERHLGGGRRWSRAALEWHGLVEGGAANLTAFPNWRTIVGTTRGEILIAGTNGNVVRWNPTSKVLESLNISPSRCGSYPPLTWRAASAGLPSQGDVYLAATGGLVGYTVSGLLAALSRRATTTA